MTALITGFLIGFFTSIPIGPINIAIILKGLNDKTEQGIMIGAGTGIMDIIYCCAAMFGMSMLISIPRIELLFRILTFIIFLAFAVKAIFLRLPEAHMHHIEDAPGVKRYFLLGIILYFSNPSFIAYWVTVAGIMHSYHVLAPTAYDNAVFAVGTGLGTFTWFFVLLELVKKYKIRFDAGRIQKISRAFGAVLLIITAVMGWNLVKTLMH